MGKNENENKGDTSLVKFISTAIRIPGIKVNRDAFLREQFKNATPELMQIIIEKGPVEAEFSRDELRKIANILIKKRTVLTTGASFAAGIPGGFAMAATIPADMLQFYGVALGLAQEISYLYGEGDLWSDNMLDNEKVTNQLILYCGVMLGATGAVQTVRVLSSSLAKQALRKLPQQALTKTFYYPIVKSIAKTFGTNMTKAAFSKGVSKVVPLIGGVVSGGITLATFPPMGKRLVDAFDEAHFSYSQTAFETDWSNIVEESEKEENGAFEIGSFEDIVETKQAPTSSVLDKIQEAKQFLDAGIINEEEFSAIKTKLISQM